MNAPFQSVVIVFFVTIVHVVVIAVYSSRTLPESTFQRSIVAPNVETLEVMPEQLIRETPPVEIADVTVSLTETSESVESEIEAPVIEDKKPEVLKEEAPAPKLEVAEKVDQPAPRPVIKAERWEDSAYAKRVSFPTLNGVIGKKPKTLADNKPNRPAPGIESKDSRGEPAPRVRSFSPIPKS